jgi:ParB-like chromosome segregation protein Spo0J
MAVEWWPLEKLIPYDNNPRIRTEKQIADIAHSIDTYGWQNHINVDTDGIIVSGHGRRLGAMKLAAEGKLKNHHPEGLVPVKVIRDLPPEKIRAFRIADNKIAEGSGWDDDLLKIEMADILAMMPDQIDMTGFTTEEADKLLGLVDKAPDAPARAKKPTTDASPAVCKACGAPVEGKP